MSHSSITTKLLSISLFAASACGTLALFNSVPLVARVTNQSAKTAFERFYPEPERKIPRWNAGDRAMTAELPPKRSNRPALPVRVNLPR
ncbi:MAG TPA: hypothetical protein V6D10_25515 [Trichocoleus sp.]